MFSASFARFINLLGLDADSPQLSSALAELGVIRRPDKPDSFSSPYEVPFRLSKHGLSLYFQESHYVNASSPSRWGKGDLQLRSVIASCGIENEVKRYEGELPFGITWQDDRAQVRAKAQATGIAGTLHEGWRDSWWLGDRYVSVYYQPGRVGAEDIPGVFEVVNGLFLPPSRPTHGLRADQYPSPAQLIAAFGLSGHSPAFQRLFAAFEPNTWDWDTHMDFSRQYGMELYFDADLPATDGTPGFVGINLKRDRLGPATAWRGELPLGLQWDMSINDAVRAIGRAPDQWNLDAEVWGWAKWFQKDHLLWVDFDTMRNRLESIALLDLRYAQA